MVRFRFLVLGAVLAVGATCVGTAEPFAFNSSPDLAALAKACAPVAGKPSPSLTRLMDALVPLEELLIGPDDVEVFPWREQFYLRIDDRLALLDATGITRCYAAKAANVLLTTEGSNTLVQRDLNAVTVTRRVELQERILAISATAFPDLVLVSTIDEFSNGASPTVLAYNLRTGTLAEIAMGFLSSTINEARDVLADDSYQLRITLEDPEQWEKTPRDSTSDGWQALELADQSKPPRPLQFPAYRGVETQWTREAAPDRPVVREIRYSETLLDALRDLAVADPADLPPGNPPAMEIFNLGYDDGPGRELTNRRKDLDEETLSFVRNYLDNGPKHLLVARDSKDYYLLTRDSGGMNLEHFIYRIIEGKPVISWSGYFRGDAPGFIGASPDGRFFFFGSIRLAGDPWLHVVRAADLREFTPSDQPLGWGPKAPQVSMDPTGKRLAVATPDGSIWIYLIDEEEAKLTLSDRIQALPHGPTEGDADAIPPMAEISQVSWSDNDTLLFDVKGKFAQALSLRTRLPRWTFPCEALSGSIALPDAGIAVLWTESQALVVDAYSGLPLGAPLAITLSEPENKYAPRFAAEMSPEGQLRIRAGNESWLRAVPKAGALSNEVARDLLARHAGMTVSNGQITRLPRLPRQLSATKSRPTPSGR